MLKILATYPDRNRAIYLAHDWVWYYRFCLAKKRAQPEGPYGDLFEVDMGGVAVALRRQLEANKAALQADTRWAGAAWNSPDGMWTRCCAPPSPCATSSVADFVPATA